jgi:hypothetical protein
MVMTLFARLVGYLFGGKRPANRRDTTSFQPHLKTCEERNAPGTILTAPLVDAVVLPVVGAMAFGDQLGLTAASAPPGRRRSGAGAETARGQ